MIRSLHLASLLLAAAVAAGCATPRLAHPELFGPDLADDAAQARAERDARGGRPEARARAGWVAVMRAQDAEAAERHWRAAVTREPATPLAWLGLGELRAARRDLVGAVDAWLRLLETTPRHPLAELAARRLARFPVTAEVPERIPRLQAVVADPTLHPDARWWADDALAHALAHQGDLEGAAERWGAGAPAAWTVVGPYARARALAQDASFPPEAGRIAATDTGPLGPLVPRAVPTNRGRLDLDGEPRWGDVTFALADLEVDDGTYLLAWQGVADLRLWIDGTPVLTRNELRAPAPRAGRLAVALSGERHRVVARIIRGSGSVGLGLTLLDAQGRPTGRWTPTAPDTPPPAGHARLRAPAAGFPEWVADQLERAPADGLAAWLDALYHLRLDDERTRARLATVFEAAPKFAWARTLEGELEAYDPAVPSSLRLARAERSFRAAAQADPLAGTAREELAALALEQGRWDAAEKWMAELEALAPDTPETVRLRARLLEDRGSPQLARGALEGLVARLGAPAVSCPLLGDLYRMRRDLDALAAADEAAQAGARCGTAGLARLADHLADRGDPEAAARLLTRLQAASPGDPDTGLRLAELQEAAGDVAAARRTLEDLAARWPRSAEVAGRLGALAARAGDAAEARRWRARQQRLDPGDLALRRARAWQAGHPLMAEDGVDLEAAIAAWQAAADDFGAGADAVMVVDHGAAWVFADDPARPVVVERVQSVWQVRTKEGVDAQGEVQLPGDAQILALYVRKPDGRRLEPEDIGVEGRISLRGLEVGDYVVTDYLVAGAERGETLPGWRAGPFFFQAVGLPVVRSTYVVRAPVEAGLEVSAHGLTPAPVRREGDTLVFRHTAERVPAWPREPDSPDPEEFLPWVRVGAGAGPDAYADAWGDYVADRAQPTWAVRSFAQEVVAALPEAERDDPRAMALALAAAVDRAVRGDRPSSRLTDRGSHALLRGRGNRLLATRAALSAVGLPSHVVLIHSFRAPPLAGRRFPAGDLFTHAVLQVPLADGDLWLDQNLRSAPLTHLRALYGGNAGLRLAEPGRPGARVDTPAPSAGADRKETRVRLAVAPDGTLEAEGQERYVGNPAAVVRRALGEVAQTRRRQAVEAGLTQALGPLAVESLGFSGAALDVGPGVPFVVDFAVRVPDWARGEPERLVIPGGALFATRLSRRLVQQAGRESPLLLDTDHREVLEATFELPPGARLTGPGMAPVSLEGPFGRYTRRVIQDDGGVRLEAVLDLTLTRVSPEAYPALVRFAAQVDAAQARPLIVALPEAPSAAPPAPPAAGDPTPAG